MAQLNDLLVMGQTTLLGPININDGKLNNKPVAFQQTPNNFIDSNNEFNFIPSEYNGVIYINYKGKDGKTTGTLSDGTNKQITTYVFCNGRGDTTAHSSIEALSYNATSDARLKENFIPLTTQKSILDLPIYKFDFINGLKNQIGCKAQDLQEICPEIVNENSNGYLSIQESKIVYLLIDEIKKLKSEIKILKNRG